MRIVVNHLTRMKTGCCVAGVDLDTGDHVRPASTHGPLPLDLLGAHGGPFDMANVVELRHSVRSIRRPHVEDRVFYPPQATRLGTASDEEFWQLLEALSRPTLGELFGPELEPHGRRCAVRPGTGNASLGCLAPARPPRLHFDEYGKLRLDLTDGTFHVSLPVTDLRLFKSDLRTPRARVIERLARRVQRGVRVLVSVGLTRPWQRPGDAEPRSWLQANNLHLEDDPTWPLAEAGRGRIMSLGARFGR